MDKTIEALKLALGQLQAGFPGNAMQILREALAQTELCKYGQEPKSCTSNPMDCQCAIDASLAQTQEPVAWTLADKVRQDLDRQSCPDAFMRIAVESIVKHHPPQRTEQDGQCKRCTNGCPACDARKLREQEPAQRTWVGLTDEEICTFSMWLDDKSDVAVFTAIEAKLKEKNT